MFITQYLLSTLAQNLIINGSMAGLRQGWETEGEVPNFFKF